MVDITETIKDAVDVTRRAENEASVDVDIASAEQAAEAARIAAFCQAQQAAADAAAAATANNNYKKFIFIYIM